MKKTTILLTSTLLLTGFNSQVCLADMANLPEVSKPIAKIWGGFNFADDSDSLNPSAAELYSIPEAATRKGTKKAAEFYSLENSPSLGLFYKANFVPHRLHLEMDVESEDDIYGDFRYSYKDIFLARFQPRRFYHNLDNIRIFDYDGNYDSPAFSGSYGVGYDADSNIQVKDLNVDDYGLRIDIDKYRLQIKTPTFPLHVYSEGEVVSRKGKQQLRFIGGTGYHSGNWRVSEARDIDQKNKEYTLGTNAHLGLVEVGYSFTHRKFENDKAAPQNYYDIASSHRTAAGLFNHNIIPTLKADTNTLKIHTSHTGRIVASATLSEIDKSNEYSGAKATNTLSYGEVSWLPKANLSFAAKMRYQRNRASRPDTVSVYGPAGPISYGASSDINCGMETDYTMSSLTARYVPSPVLNLKAEYIKDIKDVSSLSSSDYSRPLKTVKDTYALGSTWRAMPNMRVKGKLSYRDIRTEFGPTDVGNIDPAETTRGVVGVTWTISPRVAAFLNADVSKEKTDDNRIVGESNDDLSGKTINQHYLASLSFQVNEKFSVSPAYTFMSRKQDQDIAWEDSSGAHIIDRDYENEQKTHNLALNFMYMPTPMLDLNATVDYTSTKGTYDPTQAQIDFTLHGGIRNDVSVRQIGLNAYTETEEFNLRFDGEYDLGNGWGTGLVLRYTDWSDDSFDNPSDGTYIGGLFKITKELNL